MKHSIIIKTIILKISLLPKIPYITRNCSDTEQMGQGGAGRTTREKFARSLASYI